MVNKTSPRFILSCDPIYLEEHYDSFYNSLTKAYGAHPEIDLSCLPPGLKKQVYASQRFTEPLVKAMEDNVPCCVIDIDSIILKPFYVEDIFGPDLNRGDICIKVRPNHPDGMKVMAGNVIFNPTKNTKKLVKKINRILSEEMHDSPWFVDQIVIWTCILLTEGLNIVNMPDTYIDFEMNPTSHIWTGKGDRKDTNKKYLEMKKIMEGEKNDG